MKIPVLKIKDANGNLIPINAIRGEKGKSAYEQAKDGGYKGTEAEFIAILNGLTSSGDADHYSDLNNPHKVTAEQVGALPITGGDLRGGLGLVGEGDANTSEIVQNSDYATIFRNKAGDIATILALTNETKVDMADILKLWCASGNGYSIYGEHNKPSASDVGAIPETYYVSGDLNTEIQQGGSKMIVCCYTENTQNTPHTEGLTDCTHGMVITNAFNPQYATQLCMPSGENAIYLRRLNGSGISEWAKNGENNATAKIQRVSYVGTGKVGADNPVQLSFSFPPKAVFLISEIRSTGELVSRTDSYITFVDMIACPTEYTKGWGFGYSDHFMGKKGSDGKTLYFYTAYEDAYKANNRSGTTYSYLAIG